MKLIRASIQQERHGRLQTDFTSILSQNLWLGGVSVQHSTPTGFVEIDLSCYIN